MNTIVPLIALLILITLISLPILLILIISRRRKLSVYGQQPVGSQSEVPHRTDLRSPYARIPHLLTAAEGDFFTVLQVAAPADMLIFAQVRLANLVQVKPSARRDKSHWWRIQAKCVDFVVCEPHTFIPRLVIELDDRSHDRADRQERDAFVDSVLAAADIPILHIRWQRRYDVSALAAQIAGRLGINAPTLIPASLPDPAAPSDAFRPPIAPAFVPVLAPLAAPIITVAPAQARPSLIATPPTSMRRVCGTCQSDLRVEAKFCPSCGATFAFP